MAREPRSRLAAEVLPPPLYRALRHVFSQRIEACMLVGGTALAGYYAGHRRSDDLGLFTEDEVAQRAAVLAVRSLTEIGAPLTGERSSRQFHHATCRLDAHDFTVQVVLDANLFRVGEPIRVDDGVRVASLPTLLRMKAATLVSRCSEKDLYDLLWLFESERDLDIPALLALGSEIDTGMNAESVLASLVGTELRETACSFSDTRSSKEVLREITRLKEGLVRGLEAHLRGQPAAPIADLLRELE